MAYTPDLPTFARDVLLNNTYDYNAMDKQLNESWHKSFSYLYKRQLDHIGYEEHIFYTNDSRAHDKSKLGTLYIDRNNKARFDVKIELIKLVSVRDYITTGINEYDTISYDVIVNNPKVFKRIPIVMIDDCVIWDYDMVIGNDTVGFLLQYDESLPLTNGRNETTSYIYANHKIEVMLVDNYYFERVYLDKNSISLDTDYFNFYVAKQKLKNAKYISKPGCLFCSLHLTTEDGYILSAGSSLSYMEENKNAYKGTLSADFVEQIMQSTGIYLIANFIFIPNLVAHNFYFTGKNIIRAFGSTIRFRPSSSDIPTVSGIDNSYKNSSLYNIKQNTVFLDTVNLEEAYEYDEISNIVEEENEVDDNTNITPEIGEDDINEQETEQEPVEDNFNDTEDDREVYFDNITYDEEDLEEELDSDPGSEISDPYPVIEDDGIIITNTTTTTESSTNLSEITGKSSDSSYESQIDESSYSYSGSYDYILNPNINEESEERIVEYDAPLIFVEKNKETGELYNNPIPVENFIIAKKSYGETKFIYQKNTNMIHMYYPNIYEIIDPDMRSGDSYMIFYFVYSEDDELKYNNILQDWYNYLRMICDSDIYTEQIINAIYFKGLFNLAKYENTSTYLRYLQQGLPPDEIDNIIGTDIGIIKDAILDNQTEPSELVYLADYENGHIYINVKELLLEKYNVSDEDTDISSIMVDEISGTDPVYDNDLYDSNEYLDTIYNVFIKNLTHIIPKMEYSELDYTFNYKKDNPNGRKVLYKDEKLKELIELEPSIVRDYVLKQRKLGNKNYYLYTKKINLDSRYRNDIYTEFGNSGESISFTEPRYVFAIKNDTNDGKELNIRVFVDGLFVYDIYHRRKLFVDYIYIPTTYVDKEYGSFIEIEILPEYENSWDMLFSNNTKLTEYEGFYGNSLEFNTEADDINPTFSDIYVTDNEPDSNGFSTTYNIKKHFNLFSKNDIPSWYDEDSDLYLQILQTSINKPIKFTQLKEFVVEPRSEAILDKRLTLHITKKPHLYTYRMPYTGFPYLKFTKLEHDWKFDLNYLRIFKNDRLIQKSHYIFQLEFEDPRFLILDECNEDDIITIDILPYQYELQASYNDLNEDFYDHLNLIGVIKKPFDIRYYDIFVNGRKLNTTNVFSLTPWFIVFRNLVSKHNIEIYEMERDYEWYGTDYVSLYHPYLLDDLISDVFVSKSQRESIIRSFINKSKDNTLIRYSMNNDMEIYENNEEFDNKRKMVEFFLFFYDSFLPLTYLLPDTRQISSDLYTQSYGTLYNTLYKHPVDDSYDNKDVFRKVKYPSVLFIDPDVVMDGTNKLYGMINMDISKKSTVVLEGNKVYSLDMLFPFPKYSTDVYNITTSEYENYGLYVNRNGELIEIGYSTKTDEDEMYSLSVENMGDYTLSIEVDPEDDEYTNIINTTNSEPYKAYINKGILVKDFSVGIKDNIVDVCIKDNHDRMVDPFINIENVEVGGFSFYIYMLGKVGDPKKEWLEQTLITPTGILNDLDQDVQKTDIEDYYVVDDDEIVYYDTL